MKVLARLENMIETAMTDTMIIGGDFNLPQLDWSNLSIVTGSLNKEMKNIVELLAFRQMVLAPTRGGHTLDLILTNQPELADTTLVMPGLSDHSGVLCEMSIQQVKTTTAVRRQIYKYDKANAAAISEALDAYFAVFETEAECKGVNEVWLLLKDKLFELREQFVPSWVQTPRRNRSKPWFSKLLRNLIKKTHKAYGMFKRAPTKENSIKLEKISPEAKAAVRSAKYFFFKTIQSQLTQNP